MTAFIRASQVVRAVMGNIHLDAAACAGSLVVN